MCTHPLTIFNKSLYVNPRNMVASYEVPCGHCPECQQVRHSSYKLRCYYESLRVRDKHGVSVFDTLTYREDCLPKFGGVPCFNHDDIINFRKRLRINMMRDGITICELDDNGLVVDDHLKLFIVSEYGDTYKRPHYHLIAFCTAYHTDTKKPVTAWQLHQHIRKAWTYGFTDKLLKVIDLSKKGLGALHYVTKYMTKSNTEIANLKADLEKCCKHLAISYDDEKLEYLLRHHRKHFALRCWSSNNLGSYALELIAKDENVRHTFESTHGSLPIPDAHGMLSAVPIGHYYLHKLFYDRIVNPKTGKKDYFVLNDAGIAFKAGRLERCVEKTLPKIQECLAIAPDVCRKYFPNGIERDQIIDLVKWLVIYRGRVVIGDQTNESIFEDVTLENTLIDSVDPAQRYVKNAAAWVDLTGDRAAAIATVKEWKNYVGAQASAYQSVHFSRECAIWHDLQPYLKQYNEARDAERLAKQRSYDLVRAARIKMRLNSGATY